MLPSSTIDAIQNLDIVDIIGKYVNLKKKGSNWTACCPLHNEKSPSFSVNPQKQIFKCFGCGKGGDAIKFVMEHEKLDFVEAVKQIAKDHRIEIPEESASKEEEEAFKHKESLRVTNELACSWFEENLQKPEHIKALDYVKSRWNLDSISQFRIGFAPEGWDHLKNWAASNGIRQEILIESGLLQEKKDKVFDYFRNRIMFPIFDPRGRVTGFTGRDFSGSDNERKYFNTHETDVYSKKEILYGLNFARKTAREKGYLHLVEGNPDVIRLHEIGKANSVASGGTSLTHEQIQEIKKICSSVTIIGDSDKAGKAAMDRSGELLIESGLFVNVVLLPDKGKEDPDSFFKDADQFDDYVKSNIHDFILWKVKSMEQKAKNPDMKARLIDQVAKLISNLPESGHEVYLEQLSKLIKPKKAWQDALKTYKEEKIPAKEDGFKIPESVKLSDWEKYGFYADHNCYYFRTKSGVARGSNFIMEPLFHISSVLNAKRIYRITNEFGYVQVIELSQKDLVSLTPFRLRVESIGNFLFEASETELNKLKRYLYEKTESCFEITQLGWQKQGFWAWSNGIYNGSYTESDKNGIVKFHDENYYLPSSSQVYQGEDTLFVSERRFRHSQGNISLHDYASKLLEVFGENAMFGICFYLASLFRDHIIKLFGFFPILNLFGPKGAGKTELAISLMQFFGNQAKGPNLTNTTKPALADHVAMFSNACCHIDEYKNNIEYEKIEFLKGLWDGTGRTRMNMDKDRKKETTHVDAGIILSGQEMPTADIALFSRLIFLSFTKVEYTDEEKDNFNALKEIEKTGLTHITHELLELRSEFLAEFLNSYQETSKKLAIIQNGKIIEDRIFRNWLIILSSYLTLKKKISVPWSEDQLLHQATTLMNRQNQETKKSNELSIFWSIVEFLSNDGAIREEVDYKIDYVNFLKTDTMNVHWSQHKQVLFINHSRLFQMYRVHGAKSKENILPLKTLEYYLMNSKEYLGRKGSVAFKVLNESGKIDETTQSSQDRGEEHRRKITTAMAFDYDLLVNDINLTNSFTNVGQNPKEDLPF